MSESVDFSVVIPTRNRAEMLRRAIDSVLAQGDTGVEVIVVDDASSGDTAELLDTFGSQIGRVRLPRSLGVAIARNAGIATARGRFVTLLDDDDEFLPGYFKEARRVLEEGGRRLGLVFCGAIIVRDQEMGGPRVQQKLWLPRSRDPDRARNEFLERQPIGTGFGVTVPRVCFDEVGLFDESLPAAVDAEFFIRLLQRFDFGVIPRHLVKIHIHSPAQLSQLSRMRALSLAAILARHEEFFALHPRIRAAYVARTATLHFRAGDRKAALGWLTAGLRARPWSARLWRCLIANGVGIHRPRRTAQSL